eukprot:scaffold130254_cov72-Phaeocystis_antarctica.AAC.1
MHTCHGALSTHGAQSALLVSRANLSSISSIYCDLAREMAMASLGSWGPSRCSPRSCCAPGGG